VGPGLQPNTDDVREAPSLVLIREVVDSGGARARIRPAGAPHGRKTLEELRRGIDYCDTAHQACEGADALAVVTEWLEFRSPDFAWLARTLRARVLVDRPQFVRSAAGQGGRTEVLRRRRGPG